MSGRIMMTPDELNDGARYLEARLAEITQQVQALDSRIMDVSSRWEGMSQDAFMDRYLNELSPVLKQTLPEVVSALAGKLDAAANVIRDTDQELASALRG